jgi:hypothetical protein
MIDSINGICRDLPSELCFYLNEVEDCPHIVNLLNYDPAELSSLISRHLVSVGDDPRDADDLEHSLFMVCEISPLPDSVEYSKVRPIVMSWLLSEYMRYGKWDRSNKALVFQINELLSTTVSLDSLVEMCTSKSAVS